MFYDVFSMYTISFDYFFIFMFFISILHDVH
jgi:hypothetical protein